MLHNTSNFEGQTFKLFDPSTTDIYNFDVDPDQHFFSSLDVSNLCSYYNETQFNDLCMSLPPDIFSTFHLNIRSLSSNYDKFIHYLFSLKRDFSVIALSETWLTEASGEIFKLPNYNVVHNVRKNRSGGGVSLFIHDDYEFRIRTDLSLKSDKVEVESVFVELFGVSGGRNIIIGVIYRPPDSVIKNFNDSLSSSLDLINKDGKLCYILGDFNINLFKHKSETLSGDFLNVLYSSYFSPLIHKSTRVNGNSATLIDNILTNSLGKGMKSEVLYSDLSDHFPIFQYSIIKADRAKYTRKINHKRIMSKLNISKFKDMLTSISWNDIYEENNADFAYQKFMKIISYSLNECFPIGRSTKKYSKDFNKPWFTVDLSKLLRKKNKLFRKYVSNPTPLTHSVYKSHRNKYTHSVRSAKKKYFSEEFKRCSKDIKTTWKVINQLLQGERSTPELPSAFLDGENFLNNPFDIAQKCNDFFVNIGCELASKIPPCHGNPLDFIQRSFPIISSFKLPDIHGISDIIDELKSSSAGHDNISVHLV